MTATMAAVSVCQVHYERMIGLAERFIELAWWAALAVIVAAGVAAVVTWLREAKAQARVSESISPPAVLESLKALIDSLKTAPAWFAIFLAGAGLLWAANSSATSCVAMANLAASPPQTEGPPAQP